MTELLQHGPIVDVLKLKEPDPSETKPSPLLDLELQKCDDGLLLAKKHIIYAYLADIPGLVRVTASLNVTTGSSS